jgi:hypothetical protein
MKDMIGLSGVLSNLSNAYYELNLIDSALYYFIKNMVVPTGIPACRQAGNLYLKFRNE